MFMGQSADSHPPGEGDRSVDEDDRVEVTQAILDDDENEELRLDKKRVANRPLIGNLIEEIGDSERG